MIRFKKSIIISCIMSGIVSMVPVQTVYGEQDTAIEEQVPPDTQAPPPEEVATQTDVEPDRIYNATSSIYLVQGTVEIDRVVEKINALYALPAPAQQEIRQTRFMYNALTMAQKARVNNEVLLYEMEKNNGITYNYAEIYAQNTSNTDEVTSGTVKGTSYTFQLSSGGNLSVSLKYTVDNNMDGILDSPSISIKTPDANTIPISTENTELRDANMNIKITWADGFMQFDIAGGKEGKWTILTSDPVIFTEMEYAGSRQDFTPVPENTGTDAKKDDKKDIKENSSSSVGLLLRLGIFVGMIVLLVLLPKIIKKLSASKGKDKPQAQVPEKEESLEDLRAEFEKILQNDDFSDRVVQTEQKQEEVKEEVQPTQEEVNSTLDDINDNSGILYWTGTEDVPAHLSQEESQNEKADDDFDDDFFSNFT